jgi:hypothetical protein
LLCPALEKIRRPFLNDISFNTVELDFVDLPNYIKIKLLICCGFYINEIEGMYLDVIGRNLLKKLYHERNIILAQSNVVKLVFQYKYTFKLAMHKKSSYT